MTAYNTNTWDVSIVPCDSYEENSVRAALASALDAVGGLGWVKEGMTIAIKPNLVSAMKPDTAAVTHPTVILELTKMLISRGAKVVIGDSPGGLYTPAHLERVYAASGLNSVERQGVRLNRDISQTAVSFPGAHAAKSFNCVDFLLDADAVILGAVRQRIPTQNHGAVLQIQKAQGLKRKYLLLFLRKPGKCRLIHLPGVHL